MNLPQGYKQTELGVIPEDWEIKTLGELGSFSKGSGISRAEANTGSIPCVRYGEIYTHHNDYIKKYNSFISSEVAQKAKLLHYGDILFAGSGETKEDIGKSIAFIENIQAYAGGDIIILSTDTNICDAKFIGYISNTSFVNKQKATKGQGDAVVHITSDSLKNISILLPPLPEQKAIAEALSDVDDLITALDKKIAKKRLIKQGAMQELLTGKKRLPGFTDEWVNVQIKELGKWSKGQPFSKDKINRDGKNLCIHYGELFSYGEVIETIKSNTDIKPYVKSSGKDVLFPASDVTPIGLGRCSALNVKNVLLGGDIIILELTKDCPAYISYVVNLNKQQIIDRVTGTTVKHINSNLLGEIKINISTDIKEQQAIATILSDMDKEIAELEVQRDKYRLLKSGMMQKLLTGEIRLKK